MVAGLEVAQQRGVDGGHAGGGGARLVGAFKQADALLEHGDRGIAEAAVLVAVLVLEARLGLLGARVDEALRQEERFGSLAELGAQAPAVHEPGLGPQASCSCLLQKCPSWRALLAAPRATKKPARLSPASRAGPDKTVSRTAF